MFARPSLINLPFFIAGTLKIVYDLLLYREFVAVQPPEELVPLNRLLRSDGTFTGDRTACCSQCLAS